MIAAARMLSWLALGATIVPPMLFYADRMPVDQMKLWMLVATVVWFATVPIWMEE